MDKVDRDTYTFTYWGSDPWDDEPMCRYCDRPTYDCVCIGTDQDDPEDSFDRRCG